MILPQRGRLQIHLWVRSLIQLEAWGLEWGSRQIPGHNCIFMHLVLDGDIFGHLSFLVSADGGVLIEHIKLLMPLARGLRVR